MARARRSLPETTSLRQHDSWFITAPEAGARLVIQAVEPSRRTEQLYIGPVGVDFLDEMEKSAVANILCRYEDGRPIWELARFDHDHIAPERVSVPTSPVDCEVAGGAWQGERRRLLPS